MCESEYVTSVTHPMFKTFWLMSHYIVLASVRKRNFVQLRQSYNYVEINFVIRLSIIHEYAEQRNLQFFSFILLKQLIHRSTDIDSLNDHFQ